MLAEYARSFDKEEVRNNIITADFVVDGFLSDCISNLKDAKNIDEQLLLGDGGSEFAIVANTRQRDELIARAGKLSANQ